MVRLYGFPCGSYRRSFLFSGKKIAESEVRTEQCVVLISSFFAGYEAEKGIGVVIVPLCRA